MLLRLRSDSVAKTAGGSCACPLHKRVSHRPVFRIGDWVYVEKPPVTKQREAKSAAKDPSRKLASKKDGPCRVLRDHTLTIDIRVAHIFVSNHRVTLARTHQEAEPATEVSQGERANGSTDGENQPPRIGRRRCRPLAQIPS